MTKKFIWVEGDRIFSNFILSGIVLGIAWGVGAIHGAEKVLVTIVYFAVAFWLLDMMEVLFWAWRMKVKIADMWEAKRSLTMLKRVSWKKMWRMSTTDFYIRLDRARTEERLRKERLEELRSRPAPWHE